MSGDVSFVEGYKQWFIEFATNADVGALLVFIKGLRARALQIIEEEREGECNGV